MAHEYQLIQIAPDSDLGRLLDKAAGSTVVLEKAGVRYRLIPEDDDIWAGYDPAAIRCALGTSAGILSAEEAERLNTAIYSAREEGSRPATRP